ncbi:MAG: peptide chain release factor N(5)-glutamine methyltransferase [Victivallaceae bacterium]|nr:peptide chain release factor N(5)-glutamine methyltransferase [Victivallaceae bacterium]
MTTFELLKNIRDDLTAGNIESAGAEAEIILAELLDSTRPNLFMLASEPVTETVQYQAETIVKRRIAGEPLQYIQGRAYFMNICLEVRPGVLIPRPETELLVERICRDAPAGGTVCDVGTGSGAIALAIAFERPDLQVTGLDISDAALEIAERNRINCKLDNVIFLKSDLLAALNNTIFDYIAANLPYISQTEYDRLPVEVKNHEPRSALFAEDNGLAIIKRAALQMAPLMNDSGQAIFEIGATQGIGLKNFLNSTGSFKNIKIIKDLNQLNRFVYCMKS